MGVGLQGWNGTGDWTNGKSFRNMRALFPMYDTPFQAVVLRRSGIATLAQLDNKRVGVGARASATGTYSPAIVKLLGISAGISYGSFASIATDLLEGRVDAIVTLLGVPVPAIQNVEEKEPVTFLNLVPEQIETIRKAMPEFSTSKIVAGTYHSLEKDYVTVGV
jgi:TRAP transporter TAXI family solute receptor